MTAAAHPVSRRRPRCSRPAASRSSAPPATRQARRRHGPLARRASPGPSRWSTRGTPARRRPYASAPTRRGSSGPIDLAVLCVPAAVSAPGAGRRGRPGARAAPWSARGGFAEAGARRVSGTRRRSPRSPAETGIRAARARTPRASSPPAAGSRPASCPGPRPCRPGPVAVVAASGGVNHALAFLLAEAGHGVSLAVGLGNAVDVTAADVLDHLADDPATTRGGAARRVGRRRAAAARRGAPG